MPASRYIPPFPPRPTRPLSTFRLLREAQRNLIGFWPERSFERDFINYRLLRRQTVIVNSPETVREAFIDKAELIERKSPQHRRALEPLLGDGLFVSDGPTWRERRRVVAPVTHVSRLGSLTPPMTAGAEERAALWAALPAGAEIDALSEMAEMTAGIICTTLFGRDLGRANAHAVVSAFTEYQAAIGQLNIASLLGLPDIFAAFHSPRIRRAIRRIHEVLDELIAAVTSGAGGGGPSLIAAMAEAKLAGSGVPMDREAFRNEAAVLFMAGHETTAAVLAWAWFILSQDASSEARLLAEVDAVLGRRAATFEDVPNLPFTRAVIEETLRLYPPVPLQTRQAMEDMELGGKPVKKGALVILNAWLLHRHRKLWPEPDAFIPERFLPGSGQAPPRYAYVPFSIGPRICTGAAFGLTEAVICLATLAARFRLRLRPGHEVMPVCRLSLRPGGGLPMRLEPRA